ncbi:linear amide C-N hydrolase [Ruegeria atlantica]|uniref:linear amide C-N hydrolase n=1 Tax=Ruegeria atlantica TaxID=81569 RepID=UPI001480A6F9|nr:choloylglycine hydrolase family protein [Ruegeria atlantica]
MKLIKVLRKLAFVSAIASIAATQSLACTGITLTAADGSVVYGRTLEWGAFDMNSRIMISPRGHAFVAKMEDGEPGMTWEAKYGFVAVDALEKPVAVDGLNEEGLAVGVFYHPGTAEYQTFDPAMRDMSLGPLDVANYLLSQFATVEEVRAGITEIKVVPVTEPALGFPAPVHLIATDQSGAAIVIEYLNGELRVFDNPLGVITNSPSFDWHMTNLRNYINLSPVALPPVDLSEVEFAPLGGGSGMIGLPGDYTPPSRFVRAVAFSATARPTDTGDETIYELFRILDSFNVPLGATEGSDIEGDVSAMRSATLWTTAIDTQNLKLHYHTMHNRRVRMVDLNVIDFGILEEMTFLPLDREKQQDIEVVTLP